MFGNVFLKTLRDHRWGILGWGLGLGVLVLIVIFEYQQLMGGAEQRAEFAKAYQAFGFLIGEYVPIDTLGGFLTIETVVYGAAMLGLWAALVGVAITRGEEEPGVLDVLMSTPRPRVQLFWQKAAALALSVLAATALIGVLFFTGLFLSGQSLPAWGVLATLLNVVAAGTFWGALGMLVGQLVTRRRTASLSLGFVIFGTYLLNSIAETVPSLKWATWILPYHYYNLSKPLVPGRTLDPWSILVLVGSAVALLGVASWLFSRRDIGAGVPLLPSNRMPHVERRSRPGSLSMLGSVFARALRDITVPTLAWGLGLAVYCAVIIATTNEALTPLYKGMNNIPWFTKLFGQLVSNEAYLSVGIFFYMPLMLVLFALTQVWNWAGDEEEGRMEILLSEPVPRWQVALARYISAILSLAIILGCMLAASLGAAALTNVTLNAELVTGAVLAMAPLVLVGLAGGLALATWLPRPGMAVTIAGGLAVAMFFITILAPMFDWPDAVQHLSLFHFYGRPVVDGVAWPDMFMLMVVALALAAASFAGFQRRDIAK